MVVPVAVPDTICTPPELMVVLVTAPPEDTYWPPELALMIV
ncbi:hypothetical protein BJM06_a00093 (plasmid) [Enterobacter cloacae]|nr:hypothetical protein BJM06_a00093 [Enterobacter cloacae]